MDWLTNQPLKLAPCSRVLLEKVYFLKHSTNSLHFLQHKGLLIHSQGPHLSVLSRINPVVTPLYLLNINFNIILPSMPRSSKWLLSLWSLPPKPPLHSTICATHPTHLILLDLISQILFGEECRSWSASLCYLLQSHCLTFLHPRHLQMWTTGNIFLTRTEQDRQCTYNVTMSSVHATIVAAEKQRVSYIQSVHL